MRWTLIILLMCNGIYFLWQNYLLQNEQPATVVRAAKSANGAESLQLLAERSQGSQISSHAEPFLGVEKLAPGRADALAKSESSKPKICWLIGPFKEVISGRQVIGRLAALDINLKLKKIEIPGKSDYWVHLPPQLSRKAAIKLLKELQSKKVDSFLISEGELANGISLGFFSKLESAESVLNQRLKQGYGEAKIKEILRSRSELWAIFDSGEYGKLSDALWEKIKQGNKGLERRKNYCDKIASTGNFD